MFTRTVASNGRQASRASLKWILLCCLVLLTPPWTRVDGQRADPADELRNFDARVSLRSAPAVAPLASQLTALQAVQTVAPSVVATYDEVFGVTRTLMNRAGYLTDPGAGREPQQIAIDFMVANSALFGLQAGDVAEYQVTDVVPNIATSSTHVYLRQTYQGIPVYNAQFHVNINRTGRILSVNNQFVPALASSVNSLSPGVDASEAVAEAASHLRIALAAPPHRSRSRWAPTIVRGSNGTASHASPSRRD